MVAVADKTADKTSDKAAKSSAKNTSKVFDISKPNKQPSSATSRPIIVTNRPVMQDPMMVAGNANAETLPEKAPEESPSKAKMTIQPLADDTQADEKKDAAPAVASSEPETAPADTAESKDTGTSPVEPATTPPEASSSGTEDSTDELPLPGDQTKDEKETAELEAAAKKQAELDSLTESREYFLPINSVERRRSKLVTLLGGVLIVALGLLLLNLMLDAGFIRIPGVSPLTHFFSV